MPEWCCAGGGWMMILWFVLLVAVVAGIALGVRALWARGGSAEPKSSTDGHALRILEERFARGEIAADEFEERRRALLREGSNAT